MKVLVTGGAGFIGSHIVEALQGCAEVRVLDNLRSGLTRNLVGFNHEFIEGSILDRQLVRRAVKGVDYVFHLAAMASVSESIQMPVACNNINSIGTLILLEEAAKAKVAKLIFSSSAAIYGDNSVSPKTENVLPEPRSPYATSKLVGEFYCNTFTAESRLRTVCLRYFNVFGPRQEPNGAYAAVVPIFIKQAIKNEPITVHGDGKQTRDFIFIKDIVAANIHCVENLDTIGVFNVAYAKAVKILDLATKVCELTHSRSEIRHAWERPNDVKHSVASIAKFRTTGFAPTYDVANGLIATIPFFQNWTAQ